MRRRSFGSVGLVVYHLPSQRGATGLGTQMATLVLLVVLTGGVPFVAVVVLNLTVSYATLVPVQWVLPGTFFVMILSLLTRRLWFGIVAGLAAVFWSADGFALGEIDAGWEWTYYASGTLLIVLSTLLLLWPKARPSRAPAPPADRPATVATPRQPQRRVAPDPPPTSASISLADLVVYGRPSVVFIQTPTGSTGSGFIVDGNGIIITNLHVVQNNPRVSVRLFEGATATGAVAARHPRADLAVVRVPVGTLLRPLSLGDGRAIRAGSDVAALGFPLGDQLDNELTVTEGIVSAKRIYDGIAQIQTSAAINPGNSGGPLVAQNDGQAGRVIGVVTWGIDRANDGRDIENTNFAISINVVREWLRPTTR